MLVVYMGFDSYFYTLQLSKWEKQHLSTSNNLETVTQQLQNLKWKDTTKNLLYFIRIIVHKLWYFEMVSNFNLHLKTAKRLEASQQAEQQASKKQIGIGEIGEVYQK